jgi:curli biogenesis system outer membrane secretion channel CsgG
VRVGTPAAGDEVHEVEICAEVPVFDPDRPRPGRRATIAFLPLRTGRDRFEVGSDTIPADQVAAEFANEIVTWLANEKRFTVIDREYLTDVQNELSFIEGGVASGDVPPSELLKVGQLLGADYVLVGTLQEVTYKQWDEFVAIRKRNEPRAMLNANVHLRMLAVATGEIAFADGFNRTWNHAEIGRLTSSYGNIDRSLMAAKEAAQSLLPRVMAEVAKLSADQSQLAIIRIAAGEVLVANDDKALREGDELDVFRVEEIEYGGKRYPAETRIARLGVLRIQGNLAYARLIQGRIEDLYVGAACRRALD